MSSYFLMKYNHIIKIWIIPNFEIYNLHEVSLNLDLSRSVSCFAEAIWMERNFVKNVTLYFKNFQILIIFLLLWEEPGLSLMTHQFDSLGSGMTYILSITTHPFCECYGY